MSQNHIQLHICKAQKTRDAVHLRQAFILQPDEQPLRGGGARVIPQVASNGCGVDDKLLQLGKLCQLRWQ